MIAYIRLQNCQSWKDCTISLATDRINIIAADNNVGKSVLFKVLKLAGNPKYYGKDEAKRLIRNGASFARVTFVFTDGAYAVLQIEPKRCLYVFVEKKGDPVSVQLAPPKEMLEHLGLLSSEDESFIANLIDMEQGLLLVYPTLNSNYNLVKMIATNEDLDLLQERLSENIYEFKNKLSRCIEKIGFLTHQLSDLEYQDVDTMEIQLARAKIINRVLEIMCSGEDAIEVIGKATVLKKDFELLLDLVEFIDRCIEIQLVCKKQPVSIELLELLELSESGESIVQGVNVRHTIHFSNTLVKFLDVYEKAEKILSCIEVAKSVPSALELLNFNQDIFNVLKKVNVVKKPLSLCLVETLQILRSARRELNCVQIFDNNKLKRLEQEFENSGRKVECPLWGEVIWDGKECVACDT